MNERRMLLLTKTFPPTIGGVPTFCYNLSINLHSTQVTILTEKVKGADNIDERLKLMNIEVFRSGLFPRRFHLVFRFFWFINLLKLTLNMCSLIRSRNIDYIVVGQSFLFTLVSAYAASFISNTPYIIILHGEDVPQTNEKSNCIVRFLYKRSRLCICNSNFTKIRAKEFIANKTMPDEKIRILNPGVEDNFFNKVDQDELLATKMTLGLLESRIIYTISRLDERKGHDMVIRALPHILKVFPNTVYLIGGIGPSADELISLCYSLGVRNSVKFLGLVPKEKMALVHSIGEIFIMPNRILSNGDSEGFGIVFLEANAVGNPAISGKEGGVTDAVKDGFNGIQVDPHDEFSISEAVCNLLKDKAAKSTMGSNGHQRALSEYRWEQKGQEFEEILNSLNGHHEKRNNL